MAKPREIGTIVAVQPLLDILGDYGNCVGSGVNMTAEQDYWAARRICGSCAVKDVCAVYSWEARVPSVNGGDVVNVDFQIAIRRPDFDSVEFTRQAQQNFPPKSS